MDIKKVEVTDPSLPHSELAGNHAQAGRTSGTDQIPNTQTDNDTVESITERDSSGKTSTRCSFLEHRWTFTLASSQSVTLFANAWSGGSTDGDTFSFQHSINGGPLVERIQREFNQ